VNLILLHGAVGIWDEVACLVIPATAIMGVALAVLREKTPQDADEEGEATDAAAETGAPVGADAERGEEAR
jgi:hypothetical protein